MVVLKSISIFFPAYNDEKSIEKLVLDTLNVLKSITEDYEILIIDDCSPDNTGKIADKLAKTNNKIRVIHHKENKGAGGALVTGYTQSTKEYVFYTDGDAQYDINELKKFIKYIPESNIIIGYRKKRADPFIRKLTSKIYHILIFILFGLKFRDIDCSFKLIKRSLIETINFKTNSGFTDTELILNIKKRKEKIIEIPVTHYPRPYGKTQFFKFKPICEMLWDMVKMRFK